MRRSRPPPPPALPIANTGDALDPLSADAILPSSITITTSKAGVATTTHRIELAAGTTFDESRAISLNCAITIAAANIAASRVIPFAATVAKDPRGLTPVIPQGGFVTTADIATPDGGIIRAGTFLPCGFTIAAGSVFSAGTVLPVSVQCRWRRTRWCRAARCCRSSTTRSPATPR